MTTAQNRFRAIAPVYMARLLQDFPQLGRLDAAAVFGNLGHESGGLQVLQEAKPTVAGSRGGYGWAQWTGPRRRAYEKWCKANHLAPAAAEANYGYLCVELRGPEKAAIAAMKAKTSLADKVIAFEKAFERAGVKHYDSRQRWAEIALAAYDAAQKPAPAPAPAPVQPPVVVEKPVVADPGELEAAPAKSKTVWTWLLTALGAPIAAFGGLDWRVQLAIVGVIVAFAVYGIKRRFDLAAAVRGLRQDLEG